MFRATTVLFLLMSAASLSGCSGKDIASISELPPSIFEPEVEYTGEIVTLGQLAEAYITNTTSLQQANNKLGTICVAALVCEEQSDEE